MIIDSEQLLFGSLNLDSRSIEINTEVGLFINSADAAKDYREIVYRDLPRCTYRVEQDERGRLRWHYQYGEASRTYTSEPDC